MTVSQGVLIFIAIIATAVAAGGTDPHDSILSSEKSVGEVENHTTATSKDGFQRRRLAALEEEFGDLNASYANLLETMTSSAATTTVVSSTPSSSMSVPSMSTATHPSPTVFDEKATKSFLSETTVAATTRASSPLPTPTAIFAEHRKQQSIDIYRAATRGDAHRIRELAAEGADLDYRGRMDSTPLHQSAAHGRFEALNALIELGAPLEAENNAKDTPLTYAILSMCQECVKALLSAGANVNARNKNGSTPLRWAVGMDSQSIVEVLIAAGADKRVRDDKGRTPKDFAKSDTIRALLD